MTKSMGSIELTEKNKKSNNTGNILKSDIPHIIKYMGSKKPIINYIVNAINDIHIREKPICDLFSGSCSISAALRKDFDFISNDIQVYSSILAQTYFSDLSNISFYDIQSVIIQQVNTHVDYFKESYENLFFDYSIIKNIEEYQRIESLQRDLYLNVEFKTDYHLFVKYYSGTYWSFEQCVWIDALRKCAETFKEEKIYYAFMSSIMYAMSYTTQSTGHFAQYRDGNSIESMENIIIYRKRNIYELFEKKLIELVSSLDNSLKHIITTTLSFEECLKLVPQYTTVYADPPYAPVHYSRFYHALETLVKYDYPSLKFKGRYREDRHQSPFSQKSKAINAFKKLYAGIIKRDAQLVMSYSGSGVVAIKDITQLAQEMFDQQKYILEVQELDHKHSTMGRFEDHERDVIEYLIIIKFKKDA